MRAVSNFWPNILLHLLSKVHFDNKPELKGPPLAPPPITTITAYGHFQGANENF